MTKTYKILCHTIAGLVILQAMFVAWAFFGLDDWITNEDGVLNKAKIEDEGGDMDFFAEWGFAFHMFFVGFVLIPLLSLITFIVSFFVKVPAGTWKWGGGIFVLVMLQVHVIPILALEVDPIIGALHGLNAFVILGVALMAANRVKAAMGATTEASVTA